MNDPILLAGYIDEYFSKTQPVSINSSCNCGITPETLNIVILTIFFVIVFLIVLKLTLLMVAKFIKNTKKK